jgi:hypothetical protein
MVNNNIRTYAAAHFGLALDGVDKVGMFRSIEGGNVKADVMTYQSGAIYDRWRQLGKPHFEDIKLQIGMAMGQPFYAWITSFFAGVPDRKNGAIIAADFYYKERARRTFTNAMIKELTFPKLDGADKGPAYLGIGLAVEGMTFKAGDGSSVVDGNGWASQKLWTACNFAFSLDGFEPACKRVSKIDSFTVKMNVLEYHAGGHRAPIKCPSQIDFPQISFYLPESDADMFYAYAQQHIVNDSVEQPGQPGLTGYIQTYDNGNSPLFLMEFKGADICAVTPDKSDSSTEEIKQVKIDLSVESMAFSYAAMEVV